MDSKTWIDIFNSATSFGIMVAIFVSIWILIAKIDRRSKSARKPN